MATAATLAKHYDQLDGAERFVAVIEAMARGDRQEELRLDDACPRKVYEIDDPAYRNRMSISFMAVEMACASIRRDLAVLRTIGRVKDIVDVFRTNVAERAEDAFFAGWYARADGEESRELTPSLRVEVDALRDEAVIPMDILLRILKRTVAQKHAVSLLSAWEGLGRFSRDCCGLEPLTLVKAWGRLDEDPVAETKEVCPEAVVDEAEAAGWHQSLAGGWTKHIEAE